MDLSSARALMTSSKYFKVQRIMLDQYKEEAKEFALNSRYFNQDVSNPRLPPVLRCRMPRGRGRCRGVVPQLALTQMCSNCQERNAGDLNIDGLRCLSTSDQGLYQLVVLGDAPLVVGRHRIRGRLA